MTHRRILCLLVALSAAVLGGYVLAQQTRTVETEVRISARQLDDGRTEFALQQRDGAGWGERQLARARYFPEDVGHDRWLNSSPYIVRIAAPAGTETTAQQGQQEQQAEPTPTSVLSPDMEWANLWVYLADGTYGRLEATALFFYDLPEFAMDVIVTSGHRSFSYCQADPVFADIVFSLGCELPEVSHAAIDNVAAIIGAGLEESLRYDCIRNNASSAQTSVWSCLLRE